MHENRKSYTIRKTVFVPTPLMFLTKEITNCCNGHIYLPAPAYRLLALHAFRGVAGLQGQRLEQSPLGLPGSQDLQSGLMSQQQHLRKAAKGPPYFLRLLFVKSFSFRFRQETCHRTVRDKESAFTQVIGSPQQRHLLLRLLFVKSFSFRFRKETCQRAVRDKESAFTQVIGPRQQRHLLLKLLFVESFSFKYRRRICRRAIHYRGSAFVFVYHCDDSATYNSMLLFVQVQ